MKEKLLFPVFCLVCVWIFWLYNFFVYGGFSPYEQSISKASNFYAEGNMVEAKEEAEKAVALKPENPEGRLVLAKVMLDSEDLHLAEEEYKKILELKPESSEAIRDLVYIYDATQNYEEINKLLDNYSELNFLQAYIPKIPVSSKSSGFYPNPISISLKADDESSTILYTFDETEPDFTSPEYKEPITLSKGKHIVKIRTNKKGLLSEIVSLEFNIKTDYKIVNFTDKELETSLKNYLNKGIENITSSDVAEIESVLVLGKNIYFDVTDSYSAFRSVDGNYFLESVFVERDGEVVEYTEIPEGDFEGFKDLEYFTNLKSLYIYSQNSLDLLFLEDEFNLEKLTISNNGGISYIDAINKLENLEELNLINNDIEDISLLSGLENLKVLDLSFNQINDVSSITNLKTISILKLVSNNIEDVSSLLSLFNLKELYLDNNNITSIDGIGKAYKLEKLSVMNNNIKDISETESLEFLNELNT